MVLRRCSVGLAVTAVLVASLAACGGGSSAADPSAPLPITSSPVRMSATPSVTTTLDPNSDAAVIAGVRTYAAALTTAAATASLSPVQRVVTPGCTCLQGIAKSIDYLSSHTLHLNVAYSVKSAQITARKGAAATVHVVLANDPYQALRSDESVFMEEPAGSQINDFSLKFLDSTWRVDTVF